MKYEVFPAQPDDAHHLTQLMVKLESETSFMMYESDEIPKVETLQRRITVGSEGHQEIFVLAQQSSMAIGYALVFRGNLHRNCGVGTIALGVLESHSGHGVGSQLMNEAINWAQCQKLYRLQLQAHTDNDRAVNLYKRFGFQVEGILIRCSFINGQYVDKYQMSLLL